MSKDKVEDRKEKIKPKKIFSVVGIIFDDGTTSGYGVEYRDMGRLKNQKLIVPAHDDFLSCVRSIIPSSIPIIEDVVELFYGDNEDNDTGHEKTASVTIDIYNDGFVTTDFGEYIKGARGPAKCWRLTPPEFMSMVSNRLGRLADTFKPLLKASSAKDLIAHSAGVDNNDEEEDDDNEE